MNKKMFYGLRVMQIIGLIVAIVIIAFQASILRLSSNDIRLEQTEKFSFSLTNLAAAEAERYLIRHRQKDLKLLLHDLARDPMVRDATIYDHLGKILYQSKDPLELKKLINIIEPISKQEKEELVGIVPYIAELYNKGDKIGYLRISLHQDHILSLMESYQESSLTILLQVVLLAFLAGMILMALFFRRAEAAYYRLEHLIPNLIKNNHRFINKG
jgi:membrane protein